MKTNLRTRFWVETELALLSGCLFLVTLFWPDWLEDLTGLAPDNHSGSLELAIAATLIAIAGVASILAHVEWRRSRLIALRSA